MKWFYRLRSSEWWRPFFRFVYWKSFVDDLYSWDPGNKGYDPTFSSRNILSLSGKRLRPWTPTLPSSQRLGVCPSSLRRPGRPKWSEPLQVPSPEVDLTNFFRPRVSEGSSGLFSWDCYGPPRYFLCTVNRQVWYIIQPCFHWRQKR